MQLGLTPHGNYLFAYNGAQLNAHRVVNTPFRARLKSQTRVSTSPRLQSWVIDRHRSADGFRIIVLILASCTDSTHPHFAVGTAGSTGCNSPRHGANACHELFLTIRAYEDSSSFRTSRNFAGSVIVLVAPHRNNLRTLGSQIIDSGNNLATCANRATCAAIFCGMTYIADRSFKLLLAIRTYKDNLFVVACGYFAGRADILAAPHGGSLGAYGGQIIDARDNLDTCANRATGITTLQGPCNMENTGFKLLLTIGAYEPRFLVAAYRYFAGGGMCSWHST